MNLPDDALPHNAQSALPDSELICAAQAGDRQALESLLARHYPWLVNMLIHLARDPELGRDVAQDAMLAAARRLCALRDADAFRPWLYRIAANSLHSSRRGQLLRHVVSLDELMARFPWRRELVVSDERIEQYGDRAEVHDVLDHLSSTDRELLLLRYVAGFTGADIARITGISPQAARQRIARSIRRYQRYSAVQPDTLLVCEQDSVA